MLSKCHIRSVLVVAGLTSWASTASAHQHEYGITIEPVFCGLPAVANTSSNATTAFSVGGGLAFEYYPLSYAALVLRSAYTQAIGDSYIGQATFATLPGNYYFQQSAAFSTLSFRVEAPSWWLPLQFDASVGAGAMLFLQMQRELREIGTNIPFPISLPTLGRVSPVLTASGGFFGRISDEVRLNFDGTLFLIPQNVVLVGFGITVGITFLWFR